MKRSKLCAERMLLDAAREPDPRMTVDRASLPGIIAAAELRGQIKALKNIARVLRRAGWRDWSESFMYIRAARLRLQKGKP